MSTPKGFTLVELMIAIAILGILSAIALPNLRVYVLNQRVKSAAFELHAALMYARSESIKRNGDVVMSTSGTWENGWSITAGSALLKSQDTLSGVSVSNANTTLTFNRDGRLASTVGTFTISSSPDNASVSKRCISVDISGMPKTRSC